MRRGTAVSTPRGDGHVLAIRNADRFRGRDVAQILVIHDNGGRAWFLATQVVVKPQS